MFWKPEVASRKIQAVNTNGPVRAGSPHCPKNRWRAGIRNEQPMVANTAIMNDCGVRGTKLVSAIITSTWLKPCSPILISAVGSFVSMAIAAPIPDPNSAIKPAK